ncbi:MAG: DUF1206 domain-containing protein [Sneathiellaceae bacterium]
MIPVLARSGYAARGVVYSIIAWFALLAAFGAGQPMGSQDALAKLLAQPFGGLLVLAMVLGLFCFALWRLAQAGWDTDAYGRSPLGLLIRAGLVGSALAHAALALFALALLLSLSLSLGEGGEGERSLFGMVAGSPPALLAIAALVGGVGLGHFVMSWHLSFERSLPARPDLRAVCRTLGRTGLVARGIVFLLIAGLLAVGAFRVIQSDGGPPTMRDALEFLQTLPAGPLWLGLIGAGLLAFALYCFAEAAFRRIDLRLDDLT